MTDQPSPRDVIANTHHPERISGGCSCGWSSTPGSSSQTYRQHRADVAIRALTDAGYIVVHRDAAEKTIAEAILGSADRDVPPYAGYAGGPDMARSMAHHVAVALAAVAEEQR